MAGVTKADLVRENKMLRDGNMKLAAEIQSVYRDRNKFEELLRLALDRGVVVNVAPAPALSFSQTEGPAHVFPDGIPEGEANMMRWKAAMGADDDDTEELPTLTQGGLARRINEIWGDGFVPPDPFGSEEPPE